MVVGFRSELPWGHCASWTWMHSWLRTVCMGWPSTTTWPGRPTAPLCTRRASLRKFRSFIVCQMLEMLDQSVLARALFFFLVCCEGSQPVTPAEWAKWWRKLALSSAAVRRLFEDVEQAVVQRGPSGSPCPHLWPTRTTLYTQHWTNRRMSSLRGWGKRSLLPRNITLYNPPPHPTPDPCDREHSGCWNTYGLNGK